MGTSRTLRAAAAVFPERSPWMVKRIAPCAQQLAAPPWEMSLKRWEHPGIALREQGLAVSQGRREQEWDWCCSGSQRLGLCFAHRFLHLIQAGCATIGITPSSVIRERAPPCSVLCPPVELHKEKSIPGFQKKQLPVAFYSNLSHLHPPSAQAQGARPLAKLAVNSQGKQPWKSRKGAWLCWNILPQPPHPLFLAGRGFHREEIP